jgi:DNA-binding response OmpR family regulator
MSADPDLLSTQQLPAQRSNTLVGFIGPQLQPETQLRTTFAAARLRCLWLPTRAEALNAASQAVFDVLLVDASEIEADPDTLMHLRTAFDCPLIVLAQDVNDIDEIITLESGADAYLARSSSARLLRARVQALMRPLRLASTSVLDGLPEYGRTEFAGWSLNRVANTLTSDDQVLSLTEVQCALLQCLMWARGSVVSRSRLASALRHAPDLDPRSIDVYIYRLRKRLSGPPTTGLTVKAERGRGYLLASQTS